MFGIKKTPGKSRTVDSENTLPNKDGLYHKFENIRQSLLKSRELADQNASLKNHQVWVVDIFSVLVNADAIVNEYEAGINPNSVYGVTVYDRLKEEADLLEEIASMPPVNFNAKTAEDE